MTKDLTLPIVTADNIPTDTAVMISHEMWERCMWQILLRGRVTKDFMDGFEKGKDWDIVKTERKWPG